MGKQRIGFVTSDETTLRGYFPTTAEPELIPSEPPLTPDDQLAVDALRALGFSVEPVIWGCDLSEILEQLDAIVIRSPWDYMDSPESRSRFMAWITALEHTRLRIFNPPGLMRWLLDKHYLQDFESVGIPIVPTQFYSRGESLSLAEQFAKHGQLVVKPCISASGAGLTHITSLEQAEALQSAIASQLSQADLMVQPFIPEIRTRGEWSLIFIGRQYSHSVHKKPGQHSILVQAEKGGSLVLDAQPAQDIVEFAQQVFSRLTQAYAQTRQSGIHPDDILYLRIDILETADGLKLSECEGVEPELFFRARPESAERFATALAARLTY
jgi:glutathione synthase/RimK-type ligase-like ATP-grasp enzyme